MFHTFGIVVCIIIYSLFAICMIVLLIQVFIIDPRAMRRVREQRTPPSKRTQIDQTLAQAKADMIAAADLRTRKRINR